MNMEAQMLTVGRTGVITTRWSKGHPIHVARHEEGTRHYTSLCGVKLRSSDWIERKKGTFIDEEELCPGCVEHGAADEITGGRTRWRLRLPSIRIRQRRDRAGRE
jgi:hypothetical protein